jgi:hypothetical protein
MSELSPAHRFTATLPCKYDVQSFPSDAHVCPIHFNLTTGVTFNFTHDVALGEGVASDDFKVVARTMRSRDADGDIISTGCELVLTRFALSNILVIVLPTAFLTYATILMFLHDDVSNQISMAMIAILTSFALRAALVDKMPNSFSRMELWFTANAVYQFALFFAFVLIYRGCARSEKPNVCRAMHSASRPSDTVDNARAQAWSTRHVAFASVRQPPHAADS